MTHPSLPLLFLGALVTAMLALCMFVVAERHRADGLFDWAWAMAALGLAAASWALPSQTLLWLTVAVSNVLLVSAFAFTLQGLLRFQDERLHPGWLWGPVLLALLLNAALLHTPALRHWGMAAVVLAQWLYFFGLLRRHWAGIPGRSKYLFASGTTLLMGGLGAGPLVLEHVGSEISALTLYPFCMAVVIHGMGSVLMSKERSDTRNRQLAYTDELTGLHNRRAMEQHLVQQIAQACRADQTFSLLLLDIDHFKQVNDEHGHLQGDKVLCAVARVLQNSLRSQDIAGRWGGEEFLVLLPNTAAAPALVLAERLRTNVASACDVTVSIGLHSMHGLPDESADTMLDAADRALYAAKGQGRNCVATSRPRTGATAAV